MANDTRTFSCLFLLFGGAEGESICHAKSPQLLTSSNAGNPSCAAGERQTQWVKGRVRQLSECSSRGGTGTSATGKAKQRV
jgi:hypothetical protein